MVNGCEVLARVLDGDGERVWMAVAGGAAENAQQQTESENNCDNYIRRELDIDPDLWILEIEDAKGVYAPVT